MSIYVLKPAVLTVNKYNNVLGCRFSERELKDFYLEKMQLCGSDVRTAERVHDRIRNFFRRRGPEPSQLLPDEGLGAFVSETVFIRYTALAFKTTSSVLKKKLDIFVKYEEKRLKGLAPTDSEIVAANEFYYSKIPTRQDGEIWLFRNPQRHRDAFEGINLDYLAGALGLQFVAGDVRLTFGFSARDVVGCRETTFVDVSWSYLELWHFSGKTRPLSGMPAFVKGYEEVIADPPSIGRINRSLMQIRLS